MKNIYGYFDDTSDTPAVDPGLDIDCPICGAPLSAAMICSPSFMVEGDKRSYFYRVHSACHDNNPEMVSEIEGMIVDAVYKARQNN